MSERKRSPNFTEQENLLLCELLTEKHGKFQNLSNYRVDKARFGNGITKEVKKEMWRHIEEKFNASATYKRDEPGALQKKWYNLAALHRAWFSDFKRDQALTGGGQANKACTMLTHAVMDVIGRETVTISGVCETMDTSMNFILEAGSSSSGPIGQEGYQEPVWLSTSDNLPGISVDVQDQLCAHKVAISDSMSSSNVCRCQQDEEVIRLKKRKLSLQIKYYEAKLKKLEE